MDEQQRCEHWLYTETDKASMGCPYCAIENLRRQLPAATDLPGRQPEILADVAEVRRLAAHYGGYCEKILRKAADEIEARRSLTTVICDHDIYTYAAMGYGVAECKKCGKSWNEERSPVVRTGAPHADQG